LSRAITLSSCPAIISSIFSPLWPPKRSILNPKYLLNNYLSLVFYLSVYRDKIFLNWTNFKIDCTCVLTFEFIMCLIFWYDLLCVHYEYIECNFNFFLCVSRPNSSKFASCLYLITWPIPYVIYKWIWFYIKG
jgi:hypothetical protein